MRCPLGDSGEVHLRHCSARSGKILNDEYCCTKTSAVVLLTDQAKMAYSAKFVGAPHQKLVLCCANAGKYMLRWLYHCMRSKPRGNLAPCGSGKVVKIGHL